MHIQLLSLSCVPDQGISKAQKSHADIGRTLNAQIMIWCFTLLGFILF